MGGIAFAHEWPGGAVALADTKANKLLLLSLTVSSPPPPPASNGTAGNGSTAQEAVVDSTASQSLRHVICAHGVPAREGERCNAHVALLAGSSPGYLDGMGVRTRFYRPRGLSMDYLTRTLYVADTSNMLIRQVGLTDVPDEVRGRGMR